ncbi:hypothetical protein [Tepidanaerobacter acetatoxydans]|uniref:hypothetical protein n=1 Tax=Tepidanaerobacter acetatoxydans TaxID=499229 RepID=UPI001BD6488D|nr:hypothetical protein [Tepidanaerobacter acetatoxydans]
MKTIVRICKKDNPYVMLDKEFLNNANLSWRSKGLLAYFLSKPDNWKIIVKDVINRGTDGRDSVLAGIRELEKNGYIEKVQIRDKETGKYMGIEYVVYEKPQNRIAAAFHPETDFPYPVKPDTVLPDTAKPTLLNNDILLNNDCTKNNNNKDIKLNKKNTHDIAQQEEDVVVVKNLLKENNEIDILSDCNDDTELEDLFSQVTGHRNDKFVSMLKAKFNPKDIKNKLQFFSKYKKTHSVKSPEGFIFEALRSGYESKDDFHESCMEICPQCGGLGYIFDPETNVAYQCQRCLGRGKIYTEAEKA